MKSFISNSYEYNEYSNVIIYFASVNQSDVMFDE